jgi:hypothetical protein
MSIPGTRHVPCVVSFGGLAVYVVAVYVVAAPSGHLPVKAIVTVRPSIGWTRPCPGGKPVRVNAGVSILSWPVKRRSDFWRRLNNTRLCTLMNETKLKLVNESIAAWRHKLQQLNPQLIEVGGEGCPLCQAFAPDCCQGCPVSDFTGCQQCEDTPYHEAIPWLNIWLCDAGNEEARKNWHDACRAEIRFLESVKQYVKDANEATVEIARRVD